MTWDELRAEWESSGLWLRCHTSGSTGAPKEIMLPKEQVRASARRTLHFFRLDAGSRFHSCLSPDYIGGKMMLIRAMESGGRFTWEKPSNRPLLAGDGAIDLLCVVPSQMEHILDSIGSLPVIGDILIGGSPIPSALRERIAASPLRCWETYGMTETASHVAIRRVADDDVPFTPLPGIKVTANEGCLAIDIAGWKRFETNDIVEMTPDGGFSVLGRKDNVIITGGLKVHPEDVERRLHPFLGSEIMVTGQEDAKWGSKVVLIVESCTLTDEDILKICRRELHKHEVPKEISRRPIPRTPNGKLKRHH